MEVTKILPELDLALLQQKANEFAMKGAIKSIEDFYTGYDSPYKKALAEKLVGKGIDSAIDLPDIIGLLNNSISTEIDTIANNAISKTFVPMVKKFLTRADAEIKLSDILKEFIEYTRFEYNDDLSVDDYRIEIVKDDGSFLYLNIYNGEVANEIHFYKKTKDGVTPKVYEIYTLPYCVDKAYGKSYLAEKTMKLSIDGATLEMPFSPKVLEDGFVSYIARLIIANTQITFDVDGFDEDMFPQRECRCD